MRVFIHLQGGFLEEVMCLLESDGVQRQRQKPYFYSLSYGFGKGVCDRHGCLYVGKMVFPVLELGKALLKKVNFYLLDDKM